jgi:VWFA-related protein
MSSWFVWRFSSGQPLLWLLTGLVALPLAVRTSAQDTFRARTDVVAIDVEVLSRQGIPLGGLTPANFEVSFGGQRRRVVSVDYIQHDVARANVARNAPSVSEAPAVPREVPAVRPQVLPGRIFILAVDELTFRPDQALAIANAARGFIAGLQPADQVGVFAYPHGPKTDPTTDHAVAARALTGVTGGRTVQVGSRYFLAPTEVADILSRGTVTHSGDLPPDVLEYVLTDICRDTARPVDCANEVVSDARTLATEYEAQAAVSLNTLRAMLAALGRSPLRKTVILLSAGVPSSEHAGGRPDFGDLPMLVGQDAARANTVVYSLFIDSYLLEDLSPTSRRPIRQGDNRSRESDLLSRSIEQIAGMAGGRMLRLITGGEPAFDQILTETSAHYLIGVEPAPTDRDGKPRLLRVQVRNLRGANVRARNWVVMPANRSPSPGNPPDRR